MRLRTKFALVLVFVTLVMGGGVFVGFDYVRDQSVARAQANVDETASMTAAQIDAQLRQRRDRVARAAAQPAAERFNHTEPFLKQFLRNSRFQTAGVVAANGTVIDYRGDVSAESREQMIGNDVSDRPPVQRALDGQVSLSRVTCDQQCEITVAAPIYVGTDVGGVLTATVSLARAGVFAPVAPVEGGDRTLRVTTTVDGKQVVLEEHTRTFDRAVTGTAQVETTGWTVSVTQSRAALSQHLRSMLYIEAISLLLVFGAVLTLGGWEYRTTLRQTDRLLAGFQALQRGEYEHRLSLRAAEEWRQVSQGFNDLVEGIREREERLQVLNRVLRHNLRNDLTVIIGNAKKIKQSTESEKLELASERILDASNSIDELGDTAREVESAMASAGSEREQVDVAETLRSVLTEFDEAYPDVEILTDLPSSLQIEAPPGTELAAEQLIENAFEHNTSDDPQVWVGADRTTHDDEEYAKITIADNGPGIPPQDRQAVMNAEESPVEHGSGLGLWFVRWFVDRADGELIIEENDPKGAIVVVALPIE